MKKILFTLVLAIMTMAVPMEAQKKAATPKNDTVPQIEAYSDTTSADSAMFDDDFPFDDEDDAWDRMSSSDTKSLMNDIGVDGGDIMGMFFVIVVLIIIFILAPVGLIGIILFFVYKSRKQKMRMMEMAMKSGKQIPVEAVGMPSQKGEDVWNKGVKQIFLGAGVGLLLWVIIGKLGMAIGVLITLIGIGNMAIGYGAKQKQKEQELHDRMFNKGSESRTSTQEPEHE
jgi:Flp pilus assembly protein TadB